MDDNALSLLSAVGASSPSGPAAIAPATDNGTVQAMLKAYGLPAPVGAPSDDLLTGNGSTSNSSLYGPLSPNQSQANVSPSTSPAQTLPVTPSGAPQTSSTTTSDTTLYSYAGNVSREDMGVTFYAYKDLPKVTDMETTLYSYAGNVARPDMAQTFWTYEDTVPTTTKDTTQFSYSGIAGVPGLAESNRFMFMGAV